MKFIRSKKTQHDLTHKDGVQEIVVEPAEILNAKFENNAKDADVNEVEIEDSDDVDSDVIEIEPSQNTRKRSTVAEFPNFKDTIELLNDGYVASESDSKDVILSSPLERYMAEISHYPLLTREEEQQLTLIYKESTDPVARQMAAYRLVVSNLRLVVFIAREYQRNIQNILDLVQEGNIGLMTAVDKFDPYKDVKFSSYATYWIRAYMLRFIINNLRLVKIGTTQAQRKLFYNLQKEKDRLIAEGFIPEAKLLAEKLNVKESEVVEMEKRLMLPEASLDAPLRSSNEKNVRTLLGILPDKYSNVEDNAVNAHLAKSIRDEIEVLKVEMDDKERDIIDSRLFTDEPQSLQEIGARHGVSRERIRQIEVKLKGELKEHLSSKLGLSEEDVIDL